MKKITLLIMLTISFSYAQDLPFDFETSPVTADMVGFDGGVITVEAVVAPQSTGNTSAKLAKFVNPLHNHSSLRQQRAGQGHARSKTLSFTE